MAYSHPKEVLDFSVVGLVSRGMSARAERQQSYDLWIRV